MFLSTETIESSAILYCCHITAQILQCIAGMVEKCQRALLVLQDRSSRSRDDLPPAMRRRPLDSVSNAGLGVVTNDIKRDLVTVGLRQTDDHRLDMIRKAGEHFRY